MRKARVTMLGKAAGTLAEQDSGYWVFQYDTEYSGPPVSLTMPIAEAEHRFDGFPPFFEGLLPEGEMLAGLLHQRKIDRSDLFSQLLAVGADTVGAVTVMEASE